MELSEFAFRTILLFMPGLIGHTIYDTLTVHKETKPTTIIVQTLFFGLTSYFVYYLLTRIPCLNLEATALDYLRDSSKALNFKEVFISSLLAIPLGFSAVLIQKHSILFRFAHKVNLSNKFSDIDVWAYVVNSKNIGWVVLRDLDNNMAYQGFVEAFSDSATDKDYIELMLKDVIIYKNDTGEEMGEMKALYLARNRDRILLEIP